MDQKTKQCPKCKMEIPFKATRCPHCRAGQHSKLAVILAVIIFGSLFILFLSDMFSSDTPAPTPTIPEFVETVSAIRLMNAYKENEVAADSQYKGHLVEVHGTIDTIGKDILDTPYVSLKASYNQYDFGTVQCMFDKNSQSQLASLSKGTEITLHGRVSGKLGNVIVRDCSIVP